MCEIHCTNDVVRMTLYEICTRTLFRHFECLKFQSWHYLCKQNLVKHFYLLVLLFIFSENLLSQVKSTRYFVPIDVKAGLTLGEIFEKADHNVTHDPGRLLNLNSGLMIRYKERFGLAIEAGAQYATYSFTARDLDNTIRMELAQVAFKAQGRAFMLWHLKNNPHSLLRTEFAAGYHFIGNDDLSRNTLNFNMYSYSQRQNIPFIRPEIGLTKIFPNGQMDLGICYEMNLSPIPKFYSDLNFQGQQSLFRTRGNFLALTVRFHVEVMKNFNPSAPTRRKPTIIREQEKSESPPVVMNEERKTRERSPFRFKGSRVVLKVWDNSEIDGDTISLIFNDKLLLDQYGLVKKKKKLIVHLEPVENTITVIAHNLGRIPPNTAAVTLRSRFKTYYLVTSTSLTHNEELKLIYKRRKE